MKRIRVGIIGVHPDKGWATLAHIPALQSLSADFEIAAISNRNLQQARLAAEKFKIPHAFGTNEELVNNPDIDLVVVTVKVANHSALITPAPKQAKQYIRSGPLASV